MFSTSFLTPISPPLPSLLRGCYFGSSSSVSRNGPLSTYPTGPWFAVYIYGILSPTGLRPCLLRHLPSLISGFDFLLNQIRTLSHERTVGPLPQSDGANTIMVVIDRLTKLWHYIPWYAGEGKLDP
jgi:hypothetical protein